MFYELKLTSGPPPPRGTLSLECPVRTQTGARVQIANPLPIDLPLKATVTGSRQVCVLCVEVCVARGADCQPAASQFSRLHTQ